MTPTLSPEHLKAHIEGSGIARDIATARGYRTLTRPEEVEALGFADFQAATARKAPVLAIPLWTVQGQQVGWQIRPDQPRIATDKKTKKKKAAKYETPYQGQVSLDVHPRVQPLLRDPTVPVWVTEGVKKGDALATHGACAIALMGGVWGFKVPEWESVPLTHRTIRIVYDSDVMEKADVKKALQVFVQFLTALEPTVQVQVAYLPSGDGTKTGVDDFLLQHNLQDLEGLLVAPPRPDETPQAKKEKQVETLLRLAAAAELLRTTEGLLYASVPVNGHHEVLGLGERGGGLRKWLVKRYREERLDLPTPAVLSQVVEALIAQAQFDGRLCEVYTRKAYVDDTLYLDLANDRWQVVAIDAAGWRILDTSPVYFRRTHGMLPLPTPDQAGTAADLYTMLPVGPDTPEARLLVGWLFGTLQPEGAHAHLAVHGEQGSAKSTTTRMLRQTLDPNKAPTRSLPKEEKDLVLAASNGAIVGLENVSSLPTWMSDALCCLSTGAGLGTRQLYTDSDEIIFAAKRPVILNGIAEVCVRGDLLDRTLVVMLPAMETTARQQETALWTAFHANHPKALGALLSAASAALTAREALTFASLPRMADFAVWVEAAAPQLGMQRGDFLALLQTNREDATAIELDATPLSAVLQAYGRTNPITETPYKDLLKMLSHAATVGGDKPLPKEWPRSPHGLAGALRRLAPALRTQGWTITAHPHRRTGSAITIHAPQPHTQPPCDEVCDDGDDGKNQSSRGNPSQIKPCDDVTIVTFLPRAENFLEQGDYKETRGEVEKKIYKQAETSSPSSHRHEVMQNNGLLRDDAKNQSSQPSLHRHTIVTAPDCLPPERRPPQPCPGCGKPTTWVIRATAYVCSHGKCGREIPRHEAG